MKRETLKSTKRVVVKIGSSVLCNKQGQILDEQVHLVAKEVASLIKKNLEIVVVSSGAIACGMDVLGFKKRPTTLDRLQACAAVGQGRIYQMYEHAFRSEGVQTAQILLTQDGLHERARFLNAKHTFESLFDMKVVPIVNENDTISTEEITFGDNDILSAVVAPLVGADLLILMSDVDGFYVKESGELKVVSLVEKIESHFEHALFDTKREQTVGGMKSKLQAAKMVMASGIPMLIVNGHKNGILKQVMDRELVGTLFSPGSKKRSITKSWLAFSTNPKGLLVVDGGAEQALKSGGKSLLASGIVSVKGSFETGSTVRIVSEKNQTEFARGVVHFSSEEIKKVAGKNTAEVRNVLGKEAPGEIVHCDQLVILE
jgi:glutamate 5-kinase